MPPLHEHIFLSEAAISEHFRAPRTFGGEPAVPPRDRVSHSDRLLALFQNITSSIEETRTTRSAAGMPTRAGTYLIFKSALNHDLITKSLENFRQGIRLMNIQEIKVDSNTQTQALVYVPHGKEKFFIERIKQYASEDNKYGRPKNAKLVNSIDDVALAFLESFWIGSRELLPGSTAGWCEVWLNLEERSNRQEELLAIFLDTLIQLDVEFKDSRINFPERTVLLIRATRQQLVELMLRSDLLAELRPAQELAGFWVEETSFDQEQWVEDVLRRLSVNANGTRVCLLDTGVNNGHRLLEPVLDNANNLTVNPAWGTSDTHDSPDGHGTLMAGIAAFGRIEEILKSTGPITVRHRLCSVKTFPPPHAPSTPTELWGDITQQGVAHAEIQNPEETVIFCLAITSRIDSFFGRPSSWSGVVDKLCFGDDGEDGRLFIVAAGNLIDDDDFKVYPNSNFDALIDNPAQAWNALTVGAFTEMIQVRDARYSSYVPIAARGELSPFSRTSIQWEPKWPLKPDVVFEGGNRLKTPTGQIAGHPDLELLSTSKAFRTRPFNTIYATSAASASASWFAANVFSRYPFAWPETVRGLIVHSSSWTRGMKDQMGFRIGDRASALRMMRAFGHGVPNLNKALNSSESYFTLIAQEQIQPFRLNNGRAEQNEIHFFKLPWPTQVLLDMGNVPVTLKVTLSYFIEPGPGEIGWKDKYRYQSHGLRFDVNNIGETEEVFRRRINVASRDESEASERFPSGSDRWMKGANSRTLGSIHSDEWNTTAAEAATSNMIAVYPVIGWWRERKHLKKVEEQTRYSLLVSLETPATEIDLYTEIQNVITTPIEIRINR